MDPELFTKYIEISSLPDIVPEARELKVNPVLVAVMVTSQPPLGPHPAASADGVRNAPAKLMLVAIASVNIFLKFILASKGNCF